MALWDKIRQILNKGADSAPSIAGEDYRMYSDSCPKCGFKEIDNFVDWNMGFGYEGAGQVTHSKRCKACSFGWWISPPIPSSDQI